MDMPKLLIADSNDEFRQILFDTLCTDYSIQACPDGKQALQLLRTFRPALLVMDLSLPELDGITLLQRAFSEGIRPAVLVTITYQNPYILSCLRNLEVDYVMCKPCDLTAIADRLADFAAALQPSQTPTLDLDSATVNQLLAMGFPTHLNGFQFLHTGIPMYMRDPGQSMTKELYVAIGAAYRKDAKQVERSIRSAIQTAWRAGDPKIWRHYFGTPAGIVPRPTASAFISRMAAALSEQGYGTKYA